MAANPAVAPALDIVRQEFALPAVAHNHDFYWERREGFSLTCAAAVEMVDKYLPPHDPEIKHSVINSLAQKELLDRKGIPSIVIPNVFDFKTPPWEMDDYNRDLRSEVGLDEGDLVLLQATRIVSRKGIELAIDFAKALNTLKRRSVFQERGLYDGRPFTEGTRIVLVLAGVSYWTQGTVDQDIRILKLAHGLNTQHPVHATMVYLAKRALELSDGKLEIQIFPIIPGMNARGRNATILLRMLKEMGTATSWAPLMAAWRKLMPRRRRS